MVKFTDDEIKKCMEEERAELLKKHQLEIDDLMEKQANEINKYDNNRLSEINKLLEIFEEYKSISDLEGTIFTKSKKLTTQNDYFIMALFKRYGIIYSWNDEYKCYEFSCRPETRIERLKKQMEALQYQIDKEMQALDINKTKIE